MMMRTDEGSKIYNGFIDCGRKVWINEGIKGFYRGASLIVAQSATGATIYFLFDKMLKDVKTIS